MPETLQSVSAAAATPTITEEVKKELEEVNKKEENSEMNDES